MRSRARLPGESGINSREMQEEREGAMSAPARRGGQGVMEAGGGCWKLRDRRRALVGIKGRSTQARLATELLRAATLSLVRRNPVQIYVQLPCQQCLKSPVRVRAALVGTRGDR